MSADTLKSVLVIHDDPDEFMTRLEQQFPSVEFACAVTPDQVDRLCRALNPQAVFSIKQPGFPVEQHRRAARHPSVRWVHVGGSGYDHIAPWDRTKLTVTNCAGVLAPHLAETTIGGILALNGHFPRYFQQMRERRWDQHAFRPLSDQTLLIVGVGHIGREVALRAQSLGMHVTGLKRTPADDPVVGNCHGLDDLPLMIGKADFVSLHLRLADETHHLIDRAMLESMKEGAFLVNTSRGPVVDESALIETLQSGHLAGAYLDVFEIEPLPVDSPLWSTPNVLISPHTADNIENWPSRMAELFATNIERWLNGEEMINRVEI